MKLYKHIISLFIIMSVCSHLQAQTANVTSGCIPLNVKFEAPNLSDYYWDFKDGASSNQQNPEHIFTDAGTWEVELYEGSGGALVGKLSIKVYPDLIIDIKADFQDGCTPFEVNFTSEIIKDPEISIQSVLWTFGDGASSSSLNPTYTYNEDGVYTVSLKVITNETECDRTVIFDDFINVSGKPVAFNVDKIASCTVPEDFTFDNKTEFDPTDSYHWDFGNGVESTEFQPGTIEYTENGLYTVTLTVTTSTGCEIAFKRNINLGAPVFALNIPEKICQGLPTLLQNQTLGDSYEWTVAEPYPGFQIGGANSQQPTVQIELEGTYELNLSVNSILGCSADTTIYLKVEVPDASFTAGPDVTCGEEFEVTLTANDDSFNSYIWTGLEQEPVVTDVNVAQMIYEAPERDSFYVNYPDSLEFGLLVIDEFGCEYETTTILKVQKPEAFFVPDEVIGIAPLTVNFQDLSTSDEPITNRDWDLGDGTMLNLGPTETQVEKTYYLPGEYWVALTITNENGCIDVTEYIKITVIDVLQFELLQGMCNANGGQEDLVICVGEEVTVVFDNPNTDLVDFHFNSDEGRFNHCWKDDIVTYEYNDPGVYPLAFELEHKGYTFFEDTIAFVTVIGAKADIEFKVDCDNTHRVEFWSESINAKTHQWYNGDETITFQENFSYDFDDAGEYWVYLDVTDPETGCPPHRDSVLVHITDIKAEFDVPKNMCDSTMYILDASASNDVWDPCVEGYLWEFDTNRPREVGEDSLMHQFPAGRQKITLTVEDINGCKDSQTQWVNVYGMDPNFTMDTTMCFPNETTLSDLTQADTTLNAWEWSIDAEGQNPNYTFTLDDVDSLGNVNVEMVVIDALGCRDSITLTSSVYEPTTALSLDNGPSICEDEIINFSAVDFNQGGSFLNFEWDFANGDVSEEQSPSYQFTEPGTWDVELSFEEASTGCRGDTSITINVFAIPEAAFDTSVDDQDVICHPETIEFSNESTTDGPVFFGWDFGNGANSNLEDPSISYSKGIWEAELIVYSIYGCSDTITRQFELVGPEGQFSIDRDTLCLDDEITLSISDTTDVNSFTWDFGDGTLIDDVSPVTHSYSFRPPGDETKIDLILRSAETGCELVQTIPITLHDVMADFELLEQDGFCEGTATLENLSIGGNNFVWTFGDQTSTDETPIFDFDQPGVVNVTLAISNDSTSCVNEIAKEITLQGVPLDYNFPNVFTPNGDDRNDYFNVVVDPGLQEEVEIVEFKVYNRWGELVYNNDTPVTGWDGTFNGKAAPAEVYSYFIDFKVSECNKGATKGNVTIIR